MLGVRILAGFAGMISFTVAANLMLKLGAAVPPAERVSVRHPRLEIGRWPRTLRLWRDSLRAFSSRSIPLNLAQVFAATQFVGVVIAASLVLGEPISAARWVGIAFVSLGILLVGLTVQA